ncbi:MAG: formate dehydrogenase accessory protein FdhE [Gemmatimonadota bacterium]
MPWTTAPVGIAGGLPGGASTEVDPTWQPWLDLLEIALAEDARAWSSAVTAPARRPAAAPLLHGAELELDDARAQALLRRLAEAAGVALASDIVARAAVRAAIQRDESALAEMAERCGTSIDAFALLAQVTAMPVLRAAASAGDDAAASAWQRGYCPTCGAWPTLAENRGIERERRLRCGACSTDWSLPLLHCAFCDELDHDKLGSLHAEGEEHLRRVETCESCHGYLKSVTTFDALTTRALLWVDISTIPLDLVAQDRGYVRPTRPGWAPILASDS